MPYLYILQDFSRFFIISKLFSNLERSLLQHSNCGQFKYPYPDFHVKFISTSSKNAKKEPEKSSVIKFRDLPDSEAPKFTILGFGCRIFLKTSHIRMLKIPLKRLIVRCSK